MSYYKTKYIADIYLNKIVKALKEAKREAKVSTIILEVTNKYPVSERAIERRLEYLADADNDMFIDAGVIKWR